MRLVRKRSECVSECVDLNRNWNWTELEGHDFVSFDLVLLWIFREIRWFSESIDLVKHSLTQIIACKQCNVSFELALRAVKLVWLFHGFVDSCNLVVGLISRNLIGIESFILVFLGGLHLNIHSLFYFCNFPGFESSPYKLCSSRLGCWGVVALQLRFLMRWRQLKGGV